MSTGKGQASAREGRGRAGDRRLAGEGGDRVDLDEQLQPGHSTGLPVLWRRLLRGGGAVPRGNVGFACRCLP